MECPADNTPPMARVLRSNRLFGPRCHVDPQARVVWLIVAVVCGAVLYMAATVKPDPRGMGTHEQLGMAPCSFVVITGLPCPTCGMTTSFAYMMHGHPWLAFKAQPAGAVLCLGTVVFVFFALHVAVTGRMVMINWERIGAVRLALGIGLLILGGWAFKMAHGLLTGSLPVH